MTGTPLQNNTQELWSLLHYIEPTKFPDMEKFNERYGRVETVDQVQQLQKRLEPHLLRRTKEDVATDIPAKEETIIDVELTTLQKQYYRAIFERCGHKGWGAEGVAVALSPGCIPKRLPRALVRF